MNKIRELREAAGLTQAELAALAGLTQSMVSQHEHGRPISPTTRRKLARALSVRISEIPANGRILHIPAAVVIARRFRGMKQAELAERAGLAQSRISDIETGVAESLSVETLQRLADALNVPADVLTLDHLPERVGT